MQVTTTDERWYQIGDKFVPSVTWIAGHYPKGIGFYKWLAQKGWDESQAIKTSAGDKGSKVHKAVEDLLNGKEIKIDSKYLNPSTTEMEELMVEEYECILSFYDWYQKVKPEICLVESMLFNSKEEYAGTVDIICKIDGVWYIIDLKTSQYIWKEHEIQISAYKHCDYYYDAKEGLIKVPIEEEPKLAILQLGYKRNKAGYKFTEIEDKFDLFLSAKKIWKEEEGNKQPHQKDYPVTIKL
jgi:hypothetical protein